MLVRPRQLDMPYATLHDAIVLAATELLRLNTQTLVMFLVCALCVILTKMMSPRISGV